jgi:photosystem II stability/assembly factor-like uncharacterized protein
MKIRSCVFQIAISFLALCCANLAAHAQWTIQTSNTTADLRGINSVDGKVAWASGTNGTVLRTVDGGANWQICTIPPGAEKLDFRGVQAFDARTAIVMSSGKGDLSRLYKTTDGCMTWKLVFTNPDKDGFWDALYFGPYVSPPAGWLLGDPVENSFALFETNDGGNSWTRRHYKGAEVQLGEQGAFAASNSSMTGPVGRAFFGSGGSGGAFAFSLRRGGCLDRCSPETLGRLEREAVWEREAVPVRSGTDSSGVFSIAWRPSSTWKIFDETVVVVGGDYLKPDERAGTAAFSLDLGRKWQPAQTMPHGYRSAVAYDAAAKMWITVGPNGTDVSTDDGKNWSALMPGAARGEAVDADRNWNALSLPFVVGPKGRIGKRTPVSSGQ